MAKHLAFANGLPACNGQVTAKHLPTVCLWRPSIRRPFACDGQAFANGLPVMAKHVPICQWFADDSQAFTHNLPVTAKHLPTVCL
jgi:hypothetical protein